MKTDAELNEIADRLLKANDEEAIEIIGNLTGEEAEQLGALSPRRAIHQANVERRLKRRR